jgi:aldehyde dehydrogenase (NAD+)
MLETDKDQMVRAINKQRSFFASHRTKSIEFRSEQLLQLKSGILKYQDKIAAALWADLHKSPEEAFLTEISIVSSEIDNHLRHLKKWAKAKRVTTPLHLWPSSGKIVYEPLGCALIIAPWNYPFQLLFNPLIGAISAGCCSILKPSPETPHVAAVITEMVAELFDPAYVTIINGGINTNTHLLKERFDVIFFTGSTAVGKIIMKAAAEHLTPVVLELGGKSPCIVDADANIAVAAKRIALGKLINAGQTCIAPDYVFAHATIKDQLIEQLALQFRTLYGENAQKSRFYPRIIHERAFNRLVGLMQKRTVVAGGTSDVSDCYIAPTIVDNVATTDPIMQEEIFGPILPVLTFEQIDEVLTYIEQNEKPLALYYFGNTATAREVIGKTSAGGTCINDTLMQIVNHHLPFGGVGNSGQGRYHGRESFLAFSHQRGVVSTPTWLDLPFKYPPFRYFKWIKKLL